MKYKKCLDYFYKYHNDIEKMKNIKAYWIYTYNL